MLSVMKVWYYPAFFLLLQSMLFNWNQTSVYVTRGMGSFWIHRSKTQVLVSLFVILLCLQSRRYNVAIVFLSSKISLSVSSRCASFSREWYSIFLPTLSFSYRTLFADNILFRNEKLHQNIFYYFVHMKNYLCFLSFFLLRNHFLFFKRVFEHLLQNNFWVKVLNFPFFDPFLLLSHFYTNFNSFFIENAH